jgi:PAS domain S-box-containing protein
MTAALAPSHPSDPSASGAPSRPPAGSGALDGIARLAARALGAPFAFVVDDTAGGGDLEYHLSSAGFAAPLLARTVLAPLAEAVASADEPLLLEDLAVRPDLAGHSVAGREVAALAGCAVVGEARENLGAVVVVDFSTRAWTADDAGALADLAAAAGPELERRRAARAGESMPLLDAQPEYLQQLFETTPAQHRTAEELRESEERFRSVIEHSSDIVAILSSGGKIDYVSPAVERVLGYDPELLRGRSIFSILHPESAESAMNAFTEVLRGAEYDEGEICKLLHADGSARLLEVRARGFKVDPAQPRVVINARDVTSEQLATRSQRRLNAFLEATPDFVAIFQPHGRALSVNRAFRQAVGIAEDDDLSSITIPDLYSRDATDLILREGIPTAVREGVWSGEILLKNADGCSIPISQVILAHKSAEGSVEFLSTLGRDITAQKAAEASVRESELRFRSVVQSLDEGLLMTDLDDVVLYANERIASITGYSPEEVVGRHASDLLLDSESASVLAERHARRLAGLAERYEVQIRRKDGELVWTEITGTPLRDPEGAVVGTLGALTDISARKALQEQLLQSQKMEAVGRLAGGVAHDFNNLLTAIKGFTELLLLDFDEVDPRRCFITEIQAAANRAASLTRQLLAFSRKQVLQPRVLDLNTSVLDMEKMLRRLIGEDVTLETLLNADPTRVKADAGQVEQVILNLAVNARDAMPQGGRITVATTSVRLTAEQIPLHADVEPGRYVALTVSDTGTGIDEKTRARIFEPFFTTKPQGKGTGLGLSTVYGIVQQSGGFIELESEMGQGSTFRILLPQVEDEVERTVRRAPVARVDGNETVLLVEDELAVRVLVRRVLDRAGYRVFEASSGLDALALLETLETPIDLLLTDVVMPGMSGRELADQLCARFSTLRVLYMSGYTDEAIVHHGVLDAGVSFLEKPFTPDLLLRRVREAIDIRAEL